MSGAIKIKTAERAYAKINLFLEITGKRPDGYHTIDSVMHRISLHDTVEIECNSSSVSYTHLDVYKRQGFVIAPNLFGEHIEKALEAVYIALAKCYLPVRMSEISSELGTKCPPVKITSAKKQWGSCIHDKCCSDVRICFSWRVMLASVHAIDSVIVHELCHISEPNHGERFWRRVKNFMPDYSDAAEELSLIHI